MGTSVGPRRIRSTLLRQVMVLGLVLCAVALVLAFPLRTYLAAKADLTQQVAVQQQLEEQDAALREQLTALQDPDYVKQQARDRLQYVMPGETVFEMHMPTLTAPVTNSVAPKAPAVPWYSRLLDTMADPAAGPAGK